MSVAELLIRRGSLETWNAEAFTVEAVFSTGAAFKRRDARGNYVEVLDNSTVNAAALIGLPVLDGHRQIGSEHVVGQVIAARRDGNTLSGTIQLSAADDVANIRTKVAEGTLRGISIGYGEAGRTESVHPQTRERTVTVIPAIREVSLVPIAADRAATTRSDNSMTTEINTDDRTQFRVAVRTLARSAGLSPEWADERIDSGDDIVAIRAAAFEELTARGAVQIRTQTTQANDNPAVILERRAEALFARVNGTAPADEARQYFADGIVDHARALLAMRNVSTAGMDREQLLRAAQHTTSDFPQLLTGVGNRTLMPAYQAAQSPLKMIARQALHNDFRTASRLKLGEIMQLPEVAESGEIKGTTRGEAAESFKLKTYGSIYALSRQALINDDLNAFGDWGRAAGRAAAETEAALLVDLLTQSTGAGPVMGEDGKRMFHTDHDNIGTAGSPTVDSLTEARKAMRLQKGLDGETPISVVPKYLLVGPELETQAEAILTQINAAATENVNPFAGKLTLLVDPRIADASWYVFSDPATVAALEYAYLSSAQGPQMASREGWDVLGMEFRVTLDFGCGPVDWRGAFRNAGA